MQILRRYGFSENVEKALIIIQQLGELYISLKEEQNFLREPYSLVKNLEKIDFYEKEGMFYVDILLPIEENLHLGD